MRALGATVSDDAKTIYEWDHCDHKGIGQPGCSVCDFEPGRKRIRAAFEALKQRDEARDALRALVSAVSARLARGEDTSPGDFDRAWQQACALLERGRP